MANNKGFQRLLAHPISNSRSLIGAKAAGVPPVPTVSPAMMGNAAVSPGGPMLGSEVKPASTGARFPAKR